MAFCTTYHSILDHNLKNIYAGNSDTRILRSASKLPAIPPQRHECTSASQRRKRQLEYNYQYHIYVPRAPAFDVLSQQSIDQMVERIKRPKTSQGYMYTDDTKSEQATSELTQNRTVTSLSRADIKNCSERLANQQTVATEVRRCLSGCIRSKSATPDLRSSCPRMTKSISQRYYPQRNCVLKDLFTKYCFTASSTTGQSYIDITCVDAEMAFGKTYESIQKQDLRHIYAGDSYTRVIRTLSKLPVIPPQRHGNTAPRRGKRETEYNYQYHIYVPRAPAFEFMSRKCINKMVHRLNRPKTEHGNAMETRSNHATCEVIQNRCVTSLTSADIKNCSERLANQQTVATEVRRCLTGCIRSKSPTPDLKSSCPRMTQSISQRYYPRAYKRLNMSQTI